MDAHTKGLMNATRRGRQDVSSGASRRCPYFREDMRLCWFEGYDGEVNRLVALGLLKDRPLALSKAGGAAVAISSILLTYRHGIGVFDIKQVWLAVLAILNMLGVPVDDRVREAQAAITEIAWRHGMAPEQTVIQRRFGQDFERILGECRDEERGGGDG